MAVPDPEAPLAARGGGDGDERAAALLRDEERARLDDLARAARTVDGEGGGAPFADLVDQLGERARGAARAGAAHGECGRAGARPRRSRRRCLRARPAPRRAARAACGTSRRGGCGRRRRRPARPRRGAARRGAGRRSRSGRCGWCRRSRESTKREAIGRSSRFSAGLSGRRTARVASRTRRKTPNAR